MECNKDDAIKAMEIAERKFNAKDIAGAKKFALKAQNLYPGLDGIAQMLVTFDVYASSENQVGGEADWYGVLGVSPQADDDAIRKQYRKLALILHPDKNKSIGAEGAFKLVSQAWSMLSEKDRRAAYDAKRNVWARNSSEGSSMLFGTNGLYNFAKTTSNAKLNKNVPHTNGSSTSGMTNKANKSNHLTFWTVCHRCRMQFEYLRTYLNQNLLCPTCRLPFFAIERPPPDSKSASHSRNSHRESKSKSNPKGDFQWIPFSGAAGVSSVSQAANVVQQTYEKVKRVREEAQAAKKQEKAMKRKNYVSENLVEKKRRVTDDIGLHNHQTGFRTPGFGMTNSLNTSTISKLNSSREPPKIELQKILMDKARKEISQKLNGCKSGSVLDSSTEKVKANETGQCQDKSKETTVITTDLHDTVPMKPQVSIPVPDPDFHSFDWNRTELDFEEGQVWALYDDVDGMPRYYAMIHRIISRDPFRVRISWLNSNNTELNPLKWVGGEFRVGRHETYDGLNCFSHKVRWRKNSSGAICIFPRKGDVWALYRNWSSDWDELTSDDVIHEYDMVEVLEDYDEGTVVIPLVKVAGFKALFHQHLDPEQVSWIPSGEIVRFSHQVPSHVLSGQEAPNALKGCRELDPAALPAKFLQVIEDVPEDIMIDKATKQRKITFQDDAKPINIVTKSAETIEEVT
ncbi:uncharacterized protein LOC141637788 [Silene latifolia]|uniref:uncharacterized protein LOC141637788 n=1 Tax=Silene latifolia TaxID=37657 RepID=UPI003D7871F9